MRSSKTNFELKLANTIKVFQIIQKHPNITRKQLQSLSALSWGSISTITSDLIKNGILLERAQNITHLGRTPKYLTICSENKLTLGIDINITALTFALCDLGGKILQSETIQIRPFAREKILAAIETYVKKYQAHFPGLRMIALSVQGKIDAARGVSLHIPNALDWENVPLKDLLQEKFGLPVYLFHDPDCLLTSTLFRIKTNEDIKNCAVLRLGDGIGLSLLINGEIYRGHRDLGLEIEHTIIDPNGFPCDCGHRGCLEMYCSLHGLLSQYNQGQERKINQKELLELAQQREKRAMNLMHKLAKYLAQAVINLVSIIAPEFLFIDGELIQYKELFEDEFRRLLPAFPATTVILSNFSQESPAVGAVLNGVALCLEEILFSAN